MSQLIANGNINDSTYILSIERTILSTALQDYNSQFEVMKDRLTHEMFYLPMHQEIFRVMNLLYEKEMPIDESFIISRVDDKYKSGIPEVIVEILSTQGVSDVAVYCNEVSEAYRKRTIMSLTLEIKKSVLEDCLDSSETLNHLKTKIEEIEKMDISSSTIKTLGEVAKEAEDEPELEKLKTGIQWLDTPKCLDGGFRLINFVFLSGEKESGKTYLATTILENMAMNGNKVGIFPLEFGRKAYWEGIKEKYPNTHKDNQKIKALKENIYIDDGVNDILDIEKRIKTMHSLGVKFVFIDSKLRITHRTFKNGSLTNMLSDVFQRLGILTQKLEIVIMMVVQMSKENYDSGKLSVKDCVDADHEASIWINIKVNKDGTRDITMGKNKQNFKRLGITCKFDRVRHSFVKVKDFENDEDENKKGGKGKYVGKSGGIPVHVDDGVEITEFQSDEEIQVHSSDKTLSQTGLDGISDILS